MCAGRVWGKTTLAMCEIVRSAIISQSVIWYVAPTFMQAKTVGWKKLFEVLPEEMIEKKNERELYVQLKNGSRIELKSADKCDSLIGLRVDFAVLDEVNDKKCFKIISAAPSCQNVLSLGSPNDLLYDLFIDPNYKPFHFTSYDNPHFPKEDIDKARENFDQKEFNQQFLAMFN